MKEILKVLIYFIIAFGFYYLIGVFLSNTWNPLHWINFGKIMYIILSITTFGKLLDK